MQALVQDQALPFLVLLRPFISGLIKRMFAPPSV